MRVDYVAKAITSNLRHLSKGDALPQAGIQVQQGNHLPAPKLRPIPGPELEKLIREVHMRPEEMIAQTMSKDDIRRLLLMARPVPMQDSYATPKGRHADFTA